MLRQGAATVVQVSEGEDHVVGIGNLRVLITRDGAAWSAQGLEIDYTAQGDSVEEAKERFANGLRATVREHLRIVGTIEPLLQVAPSEFWREFFDLAPKDERKRLAQISVHRIETDDTLDSLPWNKIEYLEKLPAQV